MNRRENAAPRVSPSQRANTPNLQGQQNLTSPMLLPFLVIS